MADHDLRGRALAGLLLSACGRPEPAAATDTSGGSSASTSVVTSATTSGAQTTDLTTSGGAASTGTAAETSSGATSSGATSSSASEAGSSSTGEPGAPVTALLDLLESTELLAASFTANSGFHDLYVQTVDVLPGDILRIRGQGEMTINNFTPAVAGQIQLVAAGAVVGTTSRQNAIESQNHHMPLWADALVVADAAGSLPVALQWAASRIDNSPKVDLEDGYGHLVIEHYRTFPSLAEAEAAGARLLAYTFTTSAELVGSYGPAAQAPADVYRVSVDVAAGDLIHLLAQVTTTYTSANEMQGQRISADGQRISPWSTSNHVAPMPNLPLWSDAVDAPAADATRVYAAAVHGVAGVGGGVLAGHGYLHGLRFSAAPAGALSYLAGAADALPQEVTVTANDPAVELLSHPLTLAAGDQVRLTGYVQLAQPGNFTEGISCRSTLELREDAAMQVVAAEAATKYVTVSLGSLPLRGEIVAPAAAAGAHTARLLIRCAREGASPKLKVSGAWLIVDHFGAA